MLVCICAHWYNYIEKQSQFQKYVIYEIAAFRRNNQYISIILFNEMNNWQIIFKFQYEI